MTRDEQDRRRSELDEWTIDDLTLHITLLEEAISESLERASNSTGRCVQAPAEIICGRQASAEYIVAPLHRIGEIN